MNVADTIALNVAGDTVALRVETEPERELRAAEVVREVLPVLRGVLLREQGHAAREQLRKSIERCEGVLFRRARR